MAAIHRAILLAMAVLLPALAISSSDNPPQKNSRELVGLWEAKRIFGPDIRGTLTIDHSSAGWRAEIAGRCAPVQIKDGAVSFQLPGAKGSFKGKFDSDVLRLAGSWYQPSLVENGTAYASPVVLAKVAETSWRGQITPADDGMTMYLMIQARDDGSLSAFVRNPERNVGRFFNLTRIERDGNTVKLLGERSAPVQDRVLADGVFRDGILSINFSGAGGTFDFKQVAADQPSDFYPRGQAHVDYFYVAPQACADGWPTATLEDVGISRQSVNRFLQMILDTPIDSVHAPEIHAILIARHGKLVLEEYFHGQHRDKLHDTRSASKSMTSTLLGACIHAGLPISVSTPVYRVMDPKASSSLDPNKRALTVEHLLTMSSGLDCDDRDPNSVGNEDVMQEQTAQRDWYRYTLDLHAVREPGKKAVYGSANPNLLGGVISRATGVPLTSLFRDLVAEPLDIGHYAMNLMPTGEPYMGGGMRLLPRDFLKLGQLMLNDGNWEGHPVLSPDWCRRATSPLNDLREFKYGYLWWVTDYPYNGRSVRAFFAGGNGGQLVLVVPQLDLAIGFLGGNYSDPVSYTAQRVYVPQYILPAVRS
jgi:CubicO group peptidase (beta-lactamase class C family)